jgi:hypothetical protein
MPSTQQALLTAPKLAVYQRYGGDIDLWVRNGRKESEIEMNDDDWFLIAELLQGLRIVNIGKASPAFQASIEKQVVDSTLDDQSRRILHQLATSRSNASC